MRNMINISAGTDYRILFVMATAGKFDQSRESI